MSIDNQKKQEYGKQFTAKVVNTLVNDYDYTASQALNALKSSSYVDMIDVDPSYVMHYSPKYWANRIAEKESNKSLVNR